MSGSLSDAYDEIEDMIANSSTFQTWTSTVTAAAAKAKIRIKGEDDSTLTYPHCLLHGGTIEHEQNSQGTRAFSLLSGEVMATFEAVVAGGNEGDQEAEFTAFADNFGNVMDDVQAMSGAASRRTVAVRVEEDPSRDSPARDVVDGQFLYSGTMVIAWGFNL